HPTTHSVSQSKTVGQSTSPIKDLFRWKLLMEAGQLAMVYENFFFGCAHRDFLDAAWCLIGGFLRGLLLNLGQQVRLVDTILDILRQCDGIFQVLLYEHARDRACPRTPIAGILHKNGYRDLGVFTWSEGKE